MTETPPVDLVRRALEEARATARSNGRSPRPAIGATRSPGGPRVRRRGWSGAGPDERDPQVLSALTTTVAQSRGWSSQVAAASLFGRWSEVVGREVAQHANPTTLQDGVLALAAESTAWATQLRLLQTQILGRIAKVLGPDVVTSLRITGPAAPSWGKGPRRIRGRGPRDTYG